MTGQGLRRSDVVEGEYDPLFGSALGDAIDRGIAMFRLMGMKAGSLECCKCSQRQTSLNSEIRITVLVNRQFLVWMPAEKLLVLFKLRYTT